MRSATSPLSGSLFDTVVGTHGDTSATAGQGAPDTAARRVRRWREMLDMVGVSYTIDAAILLIYAYAGTITFAIPLGYLACGLLSVAGFIAISETRLNDRFKEHTFVLQQTGVSLAIMLLFAYLAPEVGILFVCSIFLVFTFAALRSNLRHALLGWISASLGLAVLFCFTDRPIAMPIGTALERFATMLVFVLVLGRGMIVGLFSSSLHDSLYKRGIELREAYRRIQELAELDELTGALNRRSIMQSLDEEIIRTQLTEGNCTVALIDLDWFKRINDQFGHPAGDEVLRTFAITIFANIRSIDKFGRYGGEEFLLILPEATDSAAHRTVDRLRAIVAELDWIAISHGLSVTMSAGVATLRAGDTVDSILTRADAALYRAKALGRNQVIST
jgi:diguanylate cyclase (GGDEF)-like protein